MSRRFLFLCLTSLLSATAFADDVDTPVDIDTVAAVTHTSKLAEKVPLVVLDKGKKVINVSELGMAPSTTIYEVLQNFPELLDRSSSQPFSNFSVSLDDQDMGDSKTTILTQMTISDVKKIEITENAEASYAKNGATGSINIVSCDLQNGVTGHAEFDASTEANSRLSAAVNYKTDRLTIRATLNGEFVRYDDSKLVNYQRGDVLAYQNDIYTRQYNLSEGAKLHIEYKASSRDLLKLRLWQDYGWKKYYTENEYHDFTGEEMFSFSQVETDSTLFGNTILAFFDYEHNFNDDHKLAFELTYNFNATDNLFKTCDYSAGRDSIFSDTNQRIWPHSANANLYYEGALVNIKDHLLKLKLGIQPSYTTTFTTQIDSTYRTVNPMRDTVNSSTWKLTVSPYMEMNYAFSHWFTLNLGARYSYDRINQWEESHAYHSYMYNLFCNIMPSDGHTIRLGAMRNYMSPTFNEATGYTYSANVHYIYNGVFDEHHLNTEVGFQYSRAHLYSVSKDYNVYQGHFAAYWTYRWVSLSLAFNIFDNQHYRTNNTLDYKAYYNIRMTPTFRLPKDWQISATLMYNSSQISEYKTIARYFYTALRLAKQLGNWNIHMELADPIHYKTTDTERLSLFSANPSDPANIMKLTTATPYHRTIRLGVQYRF